MRSVCFTFSHSPLQAAVFDGMVPDDLIRVHTRICYRIEDRGEPHVSDRCEEIARHVEIVGDAVFSQLNCLAMKFRSSSGCSLKYRYPSNRMPEPNAFGCSGPIQITSFSVVAASMISWMSF